MIHPLTRVLALLSAVVLMLLFAGRAVLAQGDKPSGPESPSATITLPAAGSTNTAGTAFSITNAGTGRAGYFQVTNTKSVTAALEARTYATATNAIAISAGVMNSRAGVGSAAIVATNYGSAGTYAIIANAKGSGTAIYGYAQGGNGRGVFGSSKAASGTGSGVYGETLSASGYGVYGINRATSGNSSGVYGEASSPNGYGVYGINRNASSGNGVYGQGAVGVYGQGADNGNGVEGHGGSGLYGDGFSNGVWARGGRYGVYGEGQVGVFGNGSNYNYGVEGHGGTGLYGEGINNGVEGRGANGVYGRAVNSGNGVEGHGGNGVYGQGTVGVYGQGENNGTGVEAHGGTGLYSVGSSSGVVAIGGTTGVTGDVNSSSSNAYGGVFRHNVFVYGHVSTDGTLVGIRDPRDDTKLIQQAGIISPQQLGMTNGNVVLDNSGRATVTLPAWFGSIYGDYRYTLTPIGDSANLFVAQKVADNRFIIAGGKPGLEVSWMISGTRQDDAAKADPLNVEVDRVAVEPKSAAAPTPAASDK